LVHLLLIGLNLKVVPIVFLCSLPDAPQLYPGFQPMFRPAGSHDLEQLQDAHLFHCLSVLCGFRSGELLLSRNDAGA